MGRDAVDQLLGQLGRLELGPGQLEGGSELSEEVAHAGLAPGDAVGQERAHEGPAQARAVADRVVDLACRGDPVVDEPERLPPQSLEQAVGDEAVDLVPHAERLHADPPAAAGRPG